MNDNVRDAMARRLKGNEAYRDGKHDEYYMPVQQYEDMETLAGAFAAGYASSVELRAAAEQAFGALAGTHAADGSVQGRARDRLRAALGTGSLRPAVVRTVPGSELSTGHRPLLVVGGVATLVSVLGVESSPWGDGFVRVRFLFPDGTEGEGDLERDGLYVVEVFRA